MTNNAISSAAQTATASVKAASHGGFSISQAQQLMDNIITLMGVSFILGVLFTTFLLLVLDFMRRNSDQED